MCPRQHAAVQAAAQPGLEGATQRRTSASSSAVMAGRRLGAPSSPPTPAAAPAAPWPSAASMSAAPATEPGLLRVAVAVAEATIGASGSSGCRLLGSVAAPSSGGRTPRSASAALHLQSAHSTPCSCGAHSLSAHSPASHASKDSHLQQWEAATQQAAPQILPVPLSVTWCLRPQRTVRSGSSPAGRSLKRPPGPSAHPGVPAQCRPRVCVHRP